MSPSKSTAAPAAVTSALPDNHLQHPESWATGGDPATGKQQAFVASLEKQHGVDLGVDEGQLGKSEASEVIDKLKQGDVEGAKDIVGTGEKRGHEAVDKGEEAGKATAASASKSEDKSSEEDSKKAASDASSAEPPAKKAKTDGDHSAAESKNGDADTSKLAASPKKTTTAGDTATSAESIAADGPTTTTDGAKIDPTKDTSTGAPAVTEANGESRLDHPENWATGASCTGLAALFLPPLTGCMRPLDVR